MASPLTLYVQIQQNERAQQTAEQGVLQYTASVSPAFNNAHLVHYSRFTLIPNPNQDLNDNPKGYLGVLLTTNFDGTMTPYLKGFWDNANFKRLIVTLGTIVYPPIAPIVSFTQFENFMNDNNLTPEPEDEWTNYYEAYPQSVDQILNAVSND